MKQPLHQRINWTDILGILGCFVFFSFLALYLENYILNEVIIVSADVTMEDWLNNVFHMWTMVGIGIALLFIIIWYAWGNSVAIDRVENTGKRVGWWILFCLLIVTTLASVFIITADEGAWVGHILFGVDVLGFFYFATALFSPSAVKYSPPGAQTLRRIINR
jgi:hypothetical protein